MELNCWEQRAVSPAMEQCSCQHGLKQDFNAACGTLGLQDREGNKCRRGRKVCAVRSNDKHHSSLMQQQRLVVKDGNNSSPLFSILPFHSRHLCLPLLSASITLLVFLLFSSSFLPYSPPRLDLFLCLQDYYGYNYYRLHRGKRRERVHTHKAAFY